MNILEQNGERRLVHQQASGPARNSLEAGGGYLLESSPGMAA